MSDYCTPVESKNDNNITTKNCCTSAFVPVKHDTVQNTHCPVCNQKGKKVDNLTLKAMLTVSLREMRDTLYYFCRTADCGVVYFSSDGCQTFTQVQVREPVYQKTPQDETVFVCYCFQHSLATIKKEWVKMGQSTVMEKIKVGIQAGQCACEVRNPQGSCCLGNVSQMVKQVKQAVFV